MSGFPIIYLDDSADSDFLRKALQEVGFPVISPRDTGLRGRDDLIHLDYASKHEYILLTFDKGYEQWSETYLQTGKNHQGILIIYKDNNIHKDMTPNQIAEALFNLLSTSPKIHNKVIDLTK